MKSRLFETMVNNTDLAAGHGNYDAPVIQPAAPASRGSDAPPLEEFVTALFIMHGIKARWVFNYWLISNAAGAESGLPAKPTYDQVMTEIKALATRTARR